MDTAALTVLASKATADIASNVTDEHLLCETPCVEFDVQSLVNHMAGFYDHDAYDSELMRESLNLLKREKFPTSERPNIDLFEIVMHGWDLAISTGQEMQVRGDVGKAILDITRRICIDERRGEGKPFGAEIQVSGDASAFEKALALSGRDPDWSPGQSSR